MIVKKPNIKNVSTVLIQYNGSAALENPQHRGLSHLWEHLKCKTWFKYQELFDKFSIQWNAFTSASRVAFYMRGTNSGMSKILPYVLGEKRNIVTYVPTKEEFEQERKVVLQEYDNVFADPESAMYHNIERRTYGFYDAIGERSVLSGLTYSKFLDFMATKVDGSGVYSTPSLIHFVGDEDVLKHCEVPEIDDNIDQFVPQIKSLRTPLRRDMTLPIECSTYYESNKALVSDYIEVPTYTPQLLQFMSYLWSSGFTSPLVTELRHKRSLTYSPTTYSLAPCPIILFYVTTAPENVDTCRTVLREMINNPENYITKQRFEDVKTRLLNAKQLESADNTSVAHVQAATDFFELSPSTIKGFDYDTCLTLLAAWKNKLRVAQVSKEMVIE